MKQTCNIRPHIAKTKLSESFKEELGNREASIFSRIEQSKFFQKEDGRLYYKKNFFAQAKSLVTELNKEYPSARTTQVVQERTKDIEAGEQFQRKFVDVNALRAYDEDVIKDMEKASDPTNDIDDKGDSVAGEVNNDFDTSYKANKIAEFTNKEFRRRTAEDDAASQTEIQFNLSNTNVKTGVSELFDSNPELANIGTQEQYSQYLDTIFPDSKVKDIVYHGTGEIFEKFNKKRTYFAKELEYAKSFPDWQTKGKKENKRIISSIINIQNIRNVNEYIDNVGIEPTDRNILSFSNSDIFEKQTIKEGFDGLEVSVKNMNEYVIFEPEQIHILGSKQDIEGFKNHVNKTSTPVTSQELKSLNHNEWFNKVIQPVINKFSQTFPQIQSQVISENDLSALPKEVQKKLSLLGKTVNSFYHNGNVYIIKERVSKAATIEEFLHPFVNAIEVDNNELYRNLLAEAKKAMPELKNQVFSTYKDVYGSVFDLNREFLAQAMSKLMSERDINPTLYQKVMNAIKDLLNKVFGLTLGETEVNDLDSNTSLNDLVTLLAGQGKINLNLVDRGQQFSLTADQVSTYSSRVPTQGAMRDSFETIIKVNTIFQFEEEGHKYSYLDVSGLQVPYMSVSEKAGSTFLDRETFAEYAELGTIVHSILNGVVFEGKRAKNIDKEAIWNANKDKFQKFFPKKEQLFPIIDYLGEYIEALRTANKSVVMSEITLGDVEAVNQELRNRVAGTVDLLEILPNGDVVIHDLKNIILNNIGSSHQKAALEQDFRMKYYKKQLSAYAKLAKLAGLKVAKLQVVPIFIQKEDAPAVNSLIPVTAIGHHFPISVEYGIDEEKAKQFQVSYSSTFADKIVHTPYVEPKPETERDIAMKEIDQALRIQNSQKLEQGLEDIFKLIENTITQYGSSRDEFKNQLLKILQQKGELDEKGLEIIDANIKHIYKTILDKPASEVPAAFKEKVAHLMNYLNYIQEIRSGLANLQTEFSRLAYEDFADDFERMAAYNKLNDLVQSYKPNLQTILNDHLKEVSDSNLFKQMVAESVKVIDGIQHDYDERVLPIIAKTLNSQFSDEYRENIGNELRARLKSKQDFMNSLPADDARRERLQRDIDAYEAEIKKIPSEDIINQMLKGKMGDSGIFWTWMFANINNPDLIVQASTKLLRDTLFDLRVKAIEKQEEFNTEYMKRLGVFGDSRDRVKQMNKDLVYSVGNAQLVQNPVTKKWEIKEWKQMHLITDIDENAYYEHKKLILELDKAQKEGADKETIKILKDAVKKFEDEHFEAPYVEEYYKLLKSIDVNLVEGNDARNPKLMMEHIFDQINNIKAQYDSYDYLQARGISDEHVRQLADLWTQYHNLFSELDENGNKKTGLDHKVWEILKKRKAELAKFRDPKTNHLLWEKLKQNVISEFGEDSEEYRQWKAKNTKILYTDEFYADRDKILSQIEEMLAPYNDENIAKEISDIWSEIFAKSKPYKNAEDTTLIPEGVKKELKKDEEKIAELRLRLDSIDIPADVRKAVGKKYAELMDIQSTEFTEQYYEDYEKALADYVTTLDKSKNYTIEQVRADEGLMEGFRNTTWFQNNHIESEKFRRNKKTKEKLLDENGDPLTIKSYKPIYLYRRTIPNDPKYYKEEPGFQYTHNTVKEETRNKNYRDVFGRRQIKKTSNFYKPEHYRKIETGTSQKDKVNLENIKFLKEQTESTQTNISNANKIYYAIPSVEKSMWERVEANGVKDTGRGMMRDLYKTAQDLSTGYKDEGQERYALADLAGEETKFIPVQYTQTIEENDQSYDVFGSMLKYTFSVEKSKLMQDKLYFFEALDNTLEKNKTVKEGVSNIVIDRMNKTFGMNLDTSIIDGGNNRVRSIKEMVNTIFYEEEKKDMYSLKIRGHEFTDGKIADAMIRYAGKAIMAFNVPNWFVNFISGNLQAVIEATGGESFTMKNFTEAKRTLNSPDFMKNVVSDWGKPNDKSLFGQMIDLFDPVQGEFEDEYGNKTSWSKRRNMDKIIFSGKVYGEWELQMSLFIAMLKAKPVKQIVNGQEQTITLYDAFEKTKTGIPKLKDGVQFNMDDVKSYAAKIHGVNKQLNGSYAKFDKMLIEKYSLGRLLAFMKKFFIPLAVNRLGEKRFDMESEGIKEGYYRVFANTVLRDLFLMRRNVLEAYKNGAYTPKQQAAIKKTLTDVGVLLAFTLLITVLGGSGTDPDDSDAKLYAKYVLLRVRREIATTSMFTAPAETYSVMKQPFVAVSTAGNLFKLAQLSIEQPIYWATGGNAFEDDLYYQKNTAVWDQGDSKLLSTVLKSVGFKVNMFHPRQLINGYNYQVQF